MLGPTSPRNNSSILCDWKKLFNFRVKTKTKSCQHQIEINRNQSHVL